jgi:hypothetical protein
MQSSAPHGEFVIVGQSPIYFGRWILRFAPEFTLAVLPCRLISAGRLQIRRFESQYVGHQNALAVHEARKLVIAGARIK